MKEKFIYSKDAVSKAILTFKILIHTFTAILLCLVLRDLMYSSFAWYNAIGYVVSGLFLFRLHWQFYLIKKEGRKLGLDMDQYLTDKFNKELD
jgi:hypothetical protein